MHGKIDKFSKTDLVSKEVSYFIDVEIVSWTVTECMSEVQI